MTYHAHSLHLTKEQIRALSQGKAVRIKHAHLHGPHMLFLTKTQVARIHRAHHKGVGVHLTLSHSALRHNRLHGGAVKDFLKGLAASGAKALINLGADQAAQHLPGLIRKGGDWLGDKASDKIKGGSFLPTGY